MAPGERRKKIKSLATITLEDLSDNSNGGTLQSKNKASEYQSLQKQIVDTSKRRKTFNEDVDNMTRANDHEVHAGIARVQRSTPSTYRRTHMEGINPRPKESVATMTSQKGRGIPESEMERSENFRLADHNMDDSSTIRTQRNSSSASPHVRKDISKIKAKESVMLNANKDKGYEQGIDKGFLKARRHDEDMSAPRNEMKSLELAKNTSLLRAQMSMSFKYPRMRTEAADLRSEKERYKHETSTSSIRRNFSYPQSHARKELVNSRTNKSVSHIGNNENEIDGYEHEIDIDDFEAGQNDEDGMNIHPIQNETQNIELETNTNIFKAQRSTPFRRVQNEVVNSKMTENTSNMYANEDETQSFEHQVDRGILRAQRSTPSTYRRAHADVVKSRLNEATSNMDASDDEAAEIEHEVDPGVIMANRTKARGPTRFETVIPKPGYGPWSILWIKGQPHGEHAGKFTGALGCYACNSQYFPIHIEWGAMHETSLIAIYFELEEKNYYKHETPEDLKNPGYFLPEDLDGNLKWARTTVQHSLRAWRSKVKKDYYLKWIKLSPEEQKDFHFDDRIDLDRWNELVAYFEDLQKQEETDKNTINCTISMATCTGGSISMVRHQEKLKQEMGASYTRMKRYLRSHTRKNGEYPNEKTKVYCEGVREVADVLSITESTDEAALSQALDAARGGHHGGYERGMGKGYSRKRQHDGSLVARSVGRTYFELAKKDKELQEMRRSLKELQDTVASLRTPETMEAGGSTGVHVQFRDDELRLMPNSTRRSASSSARKLTSSRP